jgi:competence ComEA-like helix-hairpin-helix protein
VMMLREWAGPAGYVTRDYARFAVSYVVPGEVPQDAAAAGEDETKKDEAARVSINTASAAELAAIKGLNKTVAKAVLRGRPYESIDALLDVRGIGPKLLEKLRPLISI